MCGILAIIGAYSSDETTRSELRAILVQQSKQIRHRGPDWSGVHLQNVQEGKLLNLIAHERLAIVDPVGGAQPLTSRDNNVALAVNGEIYNHVTLRQEIAATSEFKTGSDCEIILHLHLNNLDQKQICQKLDGPFAFVMCDKRSNGTVVVGRDHMGINPLYWGYCKRDATVWFGSELKCLHRYCDDFWVFPPGHCVKFTVGSTYKQVSQAIERWYEPVWRQPTYVPEDKLDLNLIRSTLEAAVDKRLMADVPFGVLLSGGLDSSLVASIVIRAMAARKAAGQSENKQGFLKLDSLHSFTIGLAKEGASGLESPDILRAREVAKFIGTVHHEFEYTLEEGLDAIPEVIRYLETYDVTTIRAGTPMYLLARRIKALGIKMVLSGEGADEIFGGYLYFHKAPNEKEFFNECVRKVNKLHMYDVLRANKATAAVGLEVRVPFLDKQFMEVAMKLNSKHKMITNETDNMEKYVLRKAFEDKENPFLPESVLWRQKEQFSDGVGYGWIDGIKERVNSTITDEDMNHVTAEFAYNTPTTKEALYYRRIFENNFAGKSAAVTFENDLSETVACSSATALEWDKQFRESKDPSGRSVVGVHDHKPKKRKTRD